jgi:glycosyltransferase involved in cell wall biosynthesis
MQVETVSESTKRDLVELMGVLEERIHVIYPGRAADFQPVGDPETPARFRAKHGLPARYLLDLGTLEPRKNLLTLVDAYARLRGRSYIDFDEMVLMVLCYIENGSPRLDFQILLRTIPAVLASRGAC